MAGGCLNLQGNSPFLVSKYVPKVAFAERFSDELKFNFRFDNKRKKKENFIDFKTVH